MNGQRSFSMLIKIMLLLSILLIGCGDGDEDSSSDQFGEDELNDDADDDSDDDSGDDDDDEDDDSDDDTEQSIEIPGDLTAQGVGENVDLSWLDNSTGESGFYLYRRNLGEENFSQVALIQSNQTDYSDIDIGSERSLEYYLTAYSLEEESEESNIAFTQTSPAPPTNVSVEAGKYFATLTWTDNSEIETGYVVERQRPSGQWISNGNLPPGTTEFTDNRVINGATYSYRVRAFGLGGFSSPGGPVEATILLQWSHEPVDSQDDVGLYISLALDDSDYSHISYYDIENSKLKYATNESGLWVNEEVTDLNDPGASTAIVADDHSTPHIAYNDPAAGALVYATKADGLWSFYTIEDTGVGPGCSMDQDVSGHLHISFYKENTKDVYYATNAKGYWETMLVFPGDDVGKYNSLAVAVDGTIHISYWNESMQDLRYAVSIVDGWQNMNVDWVGQVGTFGSLVLDGNDIPHISYYDESNGTLKMADRETGIWSVQNILGNGDSGKYSSCAIDSTNAAHISFYESANGNLVLAKENGIFWEITNLVIAGNIGEYSSIALDSNDRIHVAYYDRTNGDLRYSTEGEIPQ
jgi:hypothetical protein